MKTLRMESFTGYFLFQVCYLLNPLTLKISLVILLTVCQMILIMLVWRMWYWIN